MSINADPGSTNADPGAPSGAPRAAGTPGAADLDRIVADGRVAIDAATDLDALRAAEQAHTGKRAPLGEVQRTLVKLDHATRKDLGQRVNLARQALRDTVEARRAALEAARDTALLEAERVDVTLPGRRPAPGAVHPLERTADEVVDIFVGLGYRVAEGPQVETDWYNFQALNMPADHPARSMQDTLYVTEPDGTVGRLVLRTHTSPVQVRTMLSGPPPVYVVCPGTVYRADTPDATHLPVFRQLEVLAVDEGLTMADLKGTLEAFARAYFGEGRRIRLRPSYFPFTEPSAEFDVSCFICGGRGVVAAPSGDDGPSGETTCRTCRGEGWIEMLGAGMVHPNVLANAGYDPDRVSGFAAGLGIDRLYQLRSGLADMRVLADNDVRWLASS